MHEATDQIPKCAYQAILSYHALAKFEGFEHDLAGVFLRFAPSKPVSLMIAKNGRLVRGFRRVLRSLRADYIAASV